MTVSIAICTVQMAHHFTSSFLIFCFMSELALSVFPDQWSDVESLDSDSLNSTFSYPTREARERGNFLPLKSLATPNRKAVESNLAGTRKRTRPGPGSLLTDAHYFLPTALPLMSSATSANQSQQLPELSDNSADTSKVTTSNRLETDNQYVSGPISLQNFLRYRNDSVSPFRLESLTADYFKDTQNTSSDGSNEDHVKDIFDRFKTNNSDFLPISTEQKDSDTRDHDDSKHSESPTREKVGSMKHGQADGNGLSNSFQPQTSYPFQHFQSQQSPRSPPHQGKTNLMLERNHSLKDGSQNAFPKSGLPKTKRGKERSPPQLLNEKKDMDSDSKEDSGSRFSEESGSGKAAHSSFETQDGIGRKAPKHKNRPSSQLRNPAENSFTDSLDTHFSTPPAQHSDSDPNKHNDQEEEVMPKDDMSGGKQGVMHGDPMNEITGNGNLHRQASGGRHYPPPGGYEMPYPMPHMPPPQPFMPPYPYPMPMPMMYPPPPPPPITCCKTYYPGAHGPHPPHKPESYPHSSSNEIESVTTQTSSAKSDSASAETTGYPTIGYEVPGETFCYQEPVIPPPLLWKQMKLQKLLYPFILKKRLFFG